MERKYGVSCIYTAKLYTLYLSNNLSVPLEASARKLKDDDGKIVARFITQPKYQQSSTSKYEHKDSSNKTLPVT